MNQPTKSSSMVTILSVMMFLQFFVWGSWFATLSSAMENNSLKDFIGRAYESVPIAAIIAPLFLGLIADRLFNSERVMGVLMLVGGAIMCALPYVAAQGKESADLFLWLLFGHVICYMPTLGLGNTIAFTHIPSQQDFPRIRVWGTIGWIAAGLVLGAMGWSNTFNIFWLGGISSIVLGVMCFALPATPPPMRGEPMDIRSLLMFDAWKLMADFNFLIFAVCSTLICIPLAFYYGQTAPYLSQIGFAEPGATMTIGQMSEIIFMLLIPFFFRKLGLKMMIMIGMGCWVLRYLLFSFGAPNQITWMILLAVALHGICYDFFFVTGFMYTDQKAPKAIRGQAQSLLVFLTQGVGMFFGFRIMGAGDFLGIPLSWRPGGYGVPVDSLKYVEALKTARGESESLGFFETFTRMFSRELPETLDAELLNSTMNQWGEFWIFPGILAGIVLVIFGFMFWDKAKSDESESV